MQIQRSHAAWPASGNSHEFWQLVRPKSDSKPTLFTSPHVISCADMRCPKAHTKELLTSAGNNFTAVPIIIKKIMLHTLHLSSKQRRIVSAKIIQIPVLPECAATLATLCSEPWQQGSGQTAVVFCNLDPFTSLTRSYKNPQGPTRSLEWTYKNSCSPRAAKNKSLEHGDVICVYLLHFSINSGSP